MKRKLISLLALMLALAVMLCFAACNNTTPPDNGNGNEGTGGEGGSGEGEGGSTDPEIDWDNVPLDGMPLIYNKVARFQVVYTVEGAATAVRAAEDLVAELRDFGIEIADAVSDKDAADVKDCEIIIGTGARHRGDEANVSARYLGKSGYTGKIVGERIILAGGTSTLTKDVFNSFVKDQLGITNKTRELGDVAIDADYFLEVLTEYGISTITIGGVDLSEFTVVTDLDGMANFSTANITGFREEIYAASGYWLNEGKVEDMDSYEHKIVIRYSPTINEKYRDDGFAAYVDGGDLIIECSYANAFDSAYETFITKEITDKMNSVKLSSTYSYTKCVSKVYYKDFGAVGDG
ncbi:MAG: hypothetical protein IKD45_03155, partial [Clostridia bacterium]|nr:hypothetical protein [Clostridia bacterium]